METQGHCRDSYYVLRNRRGKPIHIGVKSRESSERKRDIQIWRYTEALTHVDLILQSVSIPWMMHSQLHTHFDSRT